MLTVIKRNLNWFMEGKMQLETLGRHILVEFYNCNEETMKSPELIEKFKNEAARRANATIVNSVFHHLYNNMARLLNYSLIK